MICVKESANRGKSSTIVIAYDELINNGATDVNVTITIGKNQYSCPCKNSEILAVLNYKGTTIGIESQGDPNGRQMFSIQEFVKQNCDIIICASRTKGSPLKHICNKSSGYDLIFMSSYYFHHTQGTRNNNLHQFGGKKIVELIDELIAGNI